LDDSFTLPASACATLKEIEDDAALGRTLAVLFKYACLGQIPDIRGESDPVVRISLQLVSESMEAWARRKAQNREAQARRRERVAVADAALTSAREKKEEAKEKAPPTPPYKEKGKEKEKRAQQACVHERIADVSRSCDAAVAEWFSKFWGAYPRKVAKRQA
jgi:hypothetical protein